MLQCCSEFPVLVCKRLTSMEFAMACKHPSKRDTLGAPKGRGLKHVGMQALPLYNWAMESARRVRSCAEQCIGAGPGIGGEWAGTCGDASPDTL